MTTTTVSSAFFEFDADAVLRRLPLTHTDRNRVRAVAADICVRRGVPETEALPVAMARLLVAGMVAMEKEVAR